jgi:predicted phosphodiesterase
MTRLAVLSDIHGNLPALEAVLADMQPFAVDQVVIAGDVVNWGPFSAAVMERVTAENWAIIRGNNEFYLLDYNTPRQPAHWQSYTLLPWLYHQLKGRWHQVIASWPDEISLRFPDAPPIRMFHGSPGNPWVNIFPLTPEAEVQSRLANVEESTIICGHSHLEMSRLVGRWHILNPGTVGVPLDGLFTARYMILDGDASGWTPTFRQVSFDYAPLFAEFERQRFVETYGVTAQLVIAEFRTARLQVQPFHEWRKAHHPNMPETPELLDLFSTIDKWPYIPLEYHLNLEQNESK